MVLLKALVLVAGIVAAAVGEVGISIACLIAWGVAHTFTQHTKAERQQQEY